MLNRKEIIAILLTTLILAFVISFNPMQTETLKIFLYSLLFVFLIILVNLIAKKVMSFYLDSEIEIGLWEFERFGVRKHQHFKTNFPAGAFLPVISKLILFPINSFVWMASLIFDVKVKTYRSAKRHGLYSFSEMTELHIGLIAAAGIISNLLIAVVAYLVGFPDQMDFAKLSIFFAFFNMLPISNLDGNKIFFGNIVMWSFLAVVVLVSLGFVFLVI